MPKLWKTALVLVFSFGVGGCGSRSSKPVPVVTDAKTRSGCDSRLPKLVRRHGGQRIKSDTVLDHLFIDAGRKLILVDSPGGSASSASVKQFDLRTHSLEFRIPIFRFAWAIHRSSHRMAYASKSGIRVADLTNGKEVFTLRLCEKDRYLTRVSRFRRPVALGPKGALLAAATSHNTVGLWQVEPKKNLGEITLGGVPGFRTELDLRIGGDGRSLVLSTHFGDWNWIFSIPRRRIVRLRRKQVIKTLVFAASNPDLAVAGFQDRQIWRYDTRTFSGRHLITAKHLPFVIAVDPRGQRLALAETERSVLYDLGSKKVLVQTKGRGTIGRVAFTPDGSRLLIHRYWPQSKESDLFHHRLTLMDALTGKRINTIQRVTQTSPGLRLAWGRDLLVGTDRSGDFTVDLRRGRLKPLVGQLGRQAKKSSLSFHFVQDILVTHDDERGLLDFWNPRTGQRLFVPGK